METIKLSKVFPVTVKKLYDAWMSSKEHSQFTGSKAVIDAKTGGKYTAWDGYISGVTISQQPYSKIVQSWRTTDFPKESPDSTLEVQFKKAIKGTKLILIHRNIPAGQEKDYEKGWIEFYFEPMKEYFL